MVDPDQVGAIQGDGIATPDVLGVDIGKRNILDNDILGADNADTLALDGGTVDADERLVAADQDAQHTGIVVRDAHGGRIRLVVVAPVVLVDGNLARRRGAPRRAAGARGGALGSAKVKGAVDDDDAGLAVAEVADELVGGRGVHGRGGATTGDALGKTLGRS